MNSGMQSVLAVMQCAIALCCLVAAGCAGVRPAPTEGPLPTGAAAVSVGRPQLATPPEAATAPAPQTALETVPAPVASLPAVLDFTSLGIRLRQTKTIGVLTKLAVKNQADDLLNGFRAYHRRQGAATLPELRLSYDMLLLKVLSLVQEGDPPLAQDIAQSRAAIWDILADPQKFTESNLMAGVTP